MTMKKQHIINDGKALCFGRAISDNSGEPCERCQKIQAKLDDKSARRAKREQDAAERKQRLAEGIMIQTASGYYALKYSAPDPDNEGKLKIIIESIGERDERRAKILFPLCMKQVRRTGKRLRNVPTCRADEL